MSSVHFNLKYLILFRRTVDLGKQVGNEVLDGIVFMSVRMACFRVNKMIEYLRDFQSVTENKTIFHVLGT